ncbi:uncharacterized protein LOC6726744 [Drosophila simulans]|uniref:GD19648 n=1 Tax=Drosophila simulans TaxID=7240 RepID=B4QW59_DROSI|nr:uncharacterized protein LOC6726744 [Drosophila simulans]EDX11658.1 GD19648 [Drosophila simulans]KMZ01514.1 uncharacterized protein Dsimw501_GD19648 [Drosophila simulans]
MSNKIYWEPAKAFRPEIEKSKINIWHRSFKPTYEQEEPQMALLLSWHYGRQWVEERDMHKKETKVKMMKEVKFIPPNYTSWLEKRRPKRTKQQLLRS